MTENMSRFVGKVVVITGAGGHRRAMSDPRDDDEPVSIEADAPEADWIEQHQPIGEAADEERLPSGALNFDGFVNSTYVARDDIRCIATAPAGQARARR